MVELSSDGTEYATIGDSSRVKAVESFDHILTVLSDTEWLSADAIITACKRNGIEAADRTIRRHLDKGFSEGLWQRRGEGTKSDPRLYRAGEPEVGTFTF